LANELILARYALILCAPITLNTPNPIARVMAISMTTQLTVQMICNVIGLIIYMLRKTKYFPLSKERACPSARDVCSPFRCKSQVAPYKALIGVLGLSFALIFTVLIGTYATQAFQDKTMDAIAYAFGIIGSVLTAGPQILQIYTIWRAKDAQGINFWKNLLQFIGSLGFGLYMTIYLGAGITTAFSFFTSALFQMIITLLVWRYRKVVPVPKDKELEELVGKANLMVQKIEMKHKGKEV
jgi:hypothetical protein